MAASFSARIAARVRRRIQRFAGIKVADTKLEFGEDQCGPVVVVIGKMRNLSPVEWKDVRFQVDPFNRKGARGSLTFLTAWQRGI